MNIRYKIMLVDDEEEVRRGIIKKINWEEAGFIVVGDAENGEEAMEKAEYLEPDVVLTDIRMPFMDGLTLGKRLRELYPSIKIVIFSGFDDFEYAKQAISIHVTEYILKPVNVEELTLILKKIKQNLDEEIEEKRDIQRLRENYGKNIPILREQLLRELIQGKQKEEQIDQNLIQYDVHLYPAKLWHVCALQIDEPAEIEEAVLSFHKERELIPISVQELVEEKLRELQPFVTFRHSGYIIIIIGSNHSSRLPSLLDQIRDICKESKRILALTITVGIGYGYDKLTELHHSYREAKNAMDYRAIMGSGSAIYIGDMERVQRSVAPLKLDSQTERELFSAIKFGREDTITSVVERMLERMGQEQVYLRQYQVYLIGIMNAIVDLIQQYGLSMDDIMGGELDYFEILSGFQSIGDLRGWLLQICFRMKAVINTGRDRAAKGLIKDAKDYIVEHYHNPELSVEVLCNDLHISPAYFSTLFKKETGQSYVGYLTDVRLSHAAELLNKTEEKTYIIAEAVGYTETNYFSYVFKKKYGISPTKYRGK